MKKIVMILGLIVVLCLSAWSYAKETSPVIKWKNQTTFYNNAIAFKQLQVFSDMVEEKSGGRLKITSYPMGELVKVADMLTAVSKGMLNMTLSVGAYWKGVIPEAEIEFGLPLSWRDQYEAFSIFDYGLRDFMRESYKKHGIYFLTEVPAGSWVLMLNKPIRKMEDFKGLKLRATGAQEVFLSKLGASTVYITGAEVYTALQLGTVDGAGWSSEAWSQNNWKDAAKYYLKTPLGVPVCQLLVNMEDWNALPDDLKNIVELSAEHFVRVASSEYLAAERLQEARMRKGELLVLPEKEVAKMKKVAIQTWDEIASKTPRNAQAVKIVKDYLKGHEVIE